MILDKLMQFDVAATAASTVVTGGVDSLNTLDMLNARDMFGGNAGGQSLEAVFTITTAFAATGGAASLRIKFQGSADDTTYNVLSITDDIPKANLTAGTVIRIPLPPQAANPQASLPRYYKLTYVAVTNNFTSGAFECDLVVNPQMNNPPVYAAGVTVTN